MVPLSSVPLARVGAAQLKTALLVFFVALQIQLAVSSSVSLTGNWTAYPGKSLSPAPTFAHLAPAGVQVTVSRDGVVLRKNVTGLTPGTTYILSLRVTSNANASVKLAIAGDATTVTTSAAPNSDIRTGRFVATANNETLAITFSTARTAAVIYLDNVTISPADNSQTIDARHMGHIDYVVPPFDNVTHVALQRCPRNTRTCYSADRNQMTCCSSACGANNDPIATCHVAAAHVPKAAGKFAAPLGATCPPSAPNPCYNHDGRSMACCPRGCGPNGGSLATCAGDADVTSAPAASPPSPTGSSASPTGSPPSPTGLSPSPTGSTPSPPGGSSLPTGASGTCPPQAPNPCYNFDGQSMACCPGACGPNGGAFAVCEESPASASVTSAPTTVSSTYPPHTPPPVDAPETLSRKKSPSPPAATKRPSLTSAPANPSPTTAPATPAPTNPPATSSPSTAPVTPSPTTPPSTPSPTSSRVTPASTTAPTTPAPTTVPVAPSGTILPAAPSGYRWVANPALTDEFNGNALDTSKWRATHPYWSGRLPSQFDPANVAVGGGVARLTSTTMVSSLDQVNDPYNDPWVSSAVISSNAGIAGYGYYECRLKASNMAMVSLFWLQSQHTEIDVIETVGIAGNYRSSRMPINTHYYPTGISATDDKFINYDYPLPNGMLTSGDFHTYGVWWKDADTLLFYFDGQLVWQMRPAGPFSERSYLFLDTEIQIFGSETLPAVADLKDPAKNAMIVDYVRAFTLESA